MSLLDVSSISYVPLYTDDDVLKLWEFDGGQNIVRDAFLEQNSRARCEIVVTGKRRGESGGIITS